MGTDQRNLDSPGRVERLTREIGRPAEADAPLLDHHLEELLQSMSELAPLVSDAETESCRQY